MQNNNNTNPFSKFDIIVSRVLIQSLSRWPDEAGLIKLF